jgi:type IX secretion system PorP/SprF family membrane protein
MKKCRNIILIGLLFAHCLQAQDMHFTQFYAAPLNLNPAFTGADVCSRVTINYRNQWPGISKAYKTYLVAGDHYFIKNRIGVGLLFANDEAGSSQLKTTLINPSVAYELNINRTTTLRLGIQPGLGIRSVNYTKLLFGDQIVRGENNATVEDKINTKTYFDANAGVLLFNNDYYLGFAAFHLTKPNESLLEGVSKLPIKFNMQGGRMFEISPPNMRHPFMQKSMNIAFHLRGQNKFDQLDIGAYYNQYIFTFGLWYRGLPIVKAYKPGYTNNDAIAFLVGYKKDGISIGYSYDLTISKLATVSNGAHEISVSYQYCPPRKKIKPRRRVACAKF